MRSDVIVKNLKWGMIYQFINMLMGFITPRFIILAYGSEINGLQGSILQIINIIALLQAGTTTASVFLMYEPLAKKQYQDVGELLYSAVLYFRKIALVFFIIMVGTAFVFTFTMKSELKYYEVFLSFFILGLKSVVDILLVSRYLIIFTADQNKYIISIANIVEKIVYYILLFVIISQQYYFVFMYIGLIVGTISKIAFYKHRYSKIYGKKLKINKKNYHYREIAGKNYSMMNEVSHTVVMSSIIIIISSLYDLKSASVYAVYNLVLSLLITIDVVIYESFASSFGHLVVEGDRAKINSVFSTFQMGFNMINTLLYMCAAYLIVPFVMIYTKDVTDINYQNSFLAVMIIIFGIMFTYRIPYNICVATHGFFKQTSIQPVVCCFISIIISLILGRICMELIIVGPIVFYAMNYLYQISKLKKLIPKMDFDYPIKQCLTSLICVVLAIVISVILPLEEIGLLMWILVAVLTCVVSAVVVFCAFVFVDRKKCLALCRYMLRILKRRLVH